MTFYFKDILAASSFFVVLALIIWKIPSIASMIVHMPMKWGPNLISYPNLTTLILTLIYGFITAIMCQELPFHGSLLVDLEMVQ